MRKFSRNEPKCQVGCRQQSDGPIFRDQRTKKVGRSRRERQCKVKRISDGKVGGNRSPCLHACAFLAQTAAGCHSHGSRSMLLSCSMRPPEVPRQCEHTYMKSTSESLSHPETSYGRAAEGNCVVARRGGEQPEADLRSQTKVNPIRFSTVASLLGTGEACRMRGNRFLPHPSSTGEKRTVGDGWGENAGKVTCGSVESCPGGNPRERSRAAVRAVIVVQATHGKSDAGTTGTMVRSRVTTGGVKDGREVERPRP